MLWIWKTKTCDSLILNWQVSHILNIWNEAKVYVNNLLDCTFFFLTFWVFINIFKWPILTSFHSRNETKFRIVRKKTSLLSQNAQETSFKYLDFKKMRLNACNTLFYNTCSTFPSRKARIRVTFLNSAYLLTFDLISRSINRPRE